MANTKRGNIQENIKSIIQGLSSIQAAEIHSTRALHVVEPSNMPYVNIITEGEYSAADSGLGTARENWKLTTTITILTKDGDIEDLRGDIKEALQADKTRGGHAINTVYERDRVTFDFDIPSGTQLIEMIFTITYILTEGTKI